MNEPANFCDGRCAMLPDNSTNAFTCSCPEQETSPLNDPPFLPGGANARNCRVPSDQVAGGLDCGTLSMSSVQHAGLHYNLHNMYGHMESVVTANALRDITGGERPFVITRSTFPGTGSHVGHWLGELCVLCVGVVWGVWLWLWL